MPGITALTEAVARYYFKLLAIKDEYEVARLYTETDFAARIAAQFEGDYKLTFHLAPPLLAKADPVTGVPRKMTFGPWMMTAFRMLAKLRRFRGSALDVFGRTAERRMERALIGDYEALVDELLAQPAPDNHAARGRDRADARAHPRLRPRQGAAREGGEGEGSCAAGAVQGAAGAGAGRGPRADRRLIADRTDATPARRSGRPSARPSVRPPANLRSSPSAAALECAAAPFRGFPMYPASSVSKSSARPDTHCGRGAILPAGDGDGSRRTPPIRLAGALLALVAPLACAASFLGVEVPPPLPAKNVVDTYWNTPVDDPYRFLENTKETAVQDWMKAQADATEAILAKLPVRAELRKRIAEIDDAVPTVVTSVVRTTSGRWFFMRRNAGENQFKLVRRDSLTGDDVVLVDPDALQKATGKPHAIGGYSRRRPTASGSPIRSPPAAPRSGAAGARRDDREGSRGADRRHPRRRRRDLAGGRQRLLLHAAAQGLGERRGDRALPRQPDATFTAWRRTAPDRAVFGPGVDPAVPMPRTASGDLVPDHGNQAGRGGGRRRRQARAVVLRRRAGRGARRQGPSWQRVFGEEAKIVGAAVAGGWLYVKTSADAPRYKVLRMPLADPDLGQAEVVIAAGDDVIVEMGAARDALYVTQRAGAADARCCACRTTRGHEARSGGAALRRPRQPRLRRTADQDGVGVRARRAGPARPSSTPSSRRRRRSHCCRSSRRGSSTRRRAWSRARCASRATTASRCRCRS